MDNTAGLLGLAKKAGKLEIGEESVSSAVRLSKARLIMSASDASASSKRHAQNLADSGGAVWITLPYDKSALGGLLGRGTPGILAITDTGLAASFAAKLALLKPDEYTDCAARLQKKLARANERKAIAAAGNPVKRRTK